MRAPWALASVVYLLLALALTWPLALSLGSALPGYPNVDALDTVGLRGLFLRLIADPAALPMTDGVYFPFSIDRMVCRVTPARSASCSWVTSAMRRCFRTSFSMSTTVARGDRCG